MIVLDIMLPDLDGLEVTRRLRADGIRVPILFLTARDALEDKVAGLTVGGDDYVTKPFSLAEIVARIHAILRRTGGAGRPDAPALRRHRDGRRRRTRCGGRASLIQLTATEFSLLRFFLLNPRRVLSKSQILDHVWHYDFGGDANIVETYVSYLRKKLDAARAAADPDHPAGRLRPPRAGLRRVAAQPPPARPRGGGGGGAAGGRRGHLLGAAVLPVEPGRPRPPIRADQIAQKSALLRRR